MNERNLLFRWNCSPGILHNKPYSSIAEDYDRFRFRILSAAYITCTLLCLCLLVVELVSGNGRLLLNYLFPFLCMTALTLYLLVYRNLRVMIPVGVLTAYVGFFCSLFFPGGYGLYILIFFNFIPLSFTLSGSRAGIRWFILFIVSIAAIWLASSTGVIPQFMPEIENRYTGVYVVSLVVMFLNIYASQIQYEKMMRSLIKSITYDWITGLPGKELFINRMKKMENSLIAIVHIVNFRKLSSLFGYEFSDSILLMVSDILREEGRSSGFRLFKLAWHEFGLQLPVRHDITAAEAEAILRRITDRVQASRIRWGDNEISVAICTGGVIVRDNNYEKAITNADTALGTGLKLHRGVTIFDDMMDVQQDALDVITRFTELHNNITNNTLKSFLQPVVNTGSGDVCWHESLLRVKGSDGSYESVYPYLAVARDTGLYPHLTDFMLRRAGEIIKTTDYSISVNICFHDMLNSRVLEQVSSITSLDNYSHGRLILEIVESEDAQYVEECFEFISKVRRMGVSIAIDDFGSGYSNFSNLLNMGIDIVKIDGALIRRLEHDNTAEALICSIIEFCKNAERIIVAEFVENSWLLNKLKELKVNYCQGYVFGAPFDPEETDKI